MAINIRKALIVSLGILFATSTILNLRLSKENEYLREKNNHKFKMWTLEWISGTRSYQEILGQQDIESVHDRARFYLEEQVRNGSVIEIMSRKPSEDDPYSNPTEELDSETRGALEKGLESISPDYFIPFSKRK